MVSASDLKVAYLSYVPLIARSFELFSDAEVVLGLVSHDGHFDNVFEILKEYCRVVPITPEVGVDAGVQAKISRLLIAASEEFATSRVSIADLDLVQLSTARWKALETFDGKELVKWGFDHPSYSQKANQGKWPMDGTTALGSVFKQLVNPNGLSNSEAIIEWADTSIDGREDVFLPFSEFSDESLLRTLALRRPVPYIEVSRHTIEQKLLSSRLDRSDFLHVQLTRKLNSGFYNEMHGFRPFVPESYVGKSVLKFLNISRSEYGRFKIRLESALREGVSWQRRF